MSNLIPARRNALPTGAEQKLEFFTKASPGLTREEFIELLLEARTSFIFGCSRASMIVAGEGLFRAVIETLKALAAKGVEAAVQLGRGKSITISPNLSEGKLFEIREVLTFAKALELLKKTEVYSSTLIEQLFAIAIKDLRNRAAHGDLPIINKWDPDSPRPKEEWRKLLFDEEFDFPEGYEFFPYISKSRPFYFDRRLYGGGSWEELTWQEKFAAIQYLLVIDSIKKLSDEL